MEKTSEWLSSFNSTNQITEQILKSKSDKTQIISITGGKGGVGKTSVSLKLARELCRERKKVLLIDSDYNLSNTAIKLGVPLNNTFFSLVSAEKTFEECLYKDDYFHLLSACNGCADLFDAEFRLEEIVIDIINEHGAAYDYVLIDCPAGLQRESLILNAYSDKRVVVVTPDKSSITDSYSLVKILSLKYGIKENHLLVNMVSSQQQFARVVKTLSETIESYLGCRTHILGGLERINVSSNNFDTEFLSVGKNSLHQSFIQVVGRLTEKVCDTRGKARGQEVH